MRMVDIISKKRDGEILTDEEIIFFVKGITRNEIPDYQAAALMMAIYFQGMNASETLTLTKCMMHSGETIDLSAISAINVDKHSTGGVGDKTTIVLAPLVASAGASVAKMTGRGLGHTGGTMDKLETFSGMNLHLDRTTFINNVQQYGIAISGQSANLVPADKKLYALRDVTATIENISLIAGSIMSKKLASGADAIVLDIKVGSGAFMKTEKDAFTLAQELVEIGEGMNRQTIGLVSRMEQPLGHAVGNALEIKEAIETLKGKGPKDLEDLCLSLGANMLVLSNNARTYEEGVKILKEKLSSGEALEKLRQLVQIQGGNPKQVDDWDLMPKATHQVDLMATSSGYVSDLDAETVGLASMLLGAGRQTKEDRIDLAAGIYLYKKIGDAIQENEVLATLYTNDESKLSLASEKLQSAYAFSNKSPRKQKLIIGKVSKLGIEME